MGYSPWGKIQHQRKIQAGIIQVMTARHGGIHVSAKLNLSIPEIFREPRGWYEEDCAAAIPMYFLLHKLDALPTIKTYFGNEWAKFVQESVVHHDS